MREGKSIKMSLALAIVAALMALCHKGYAAPPPGQGGAEGTEAVERKGPLAALPSARGRSPRCRPNPVRTWRRSRRWATASR